MTAPQLSLISLGSNLGNRAEHIEQALKSISGLPGCHLDRRSKLYETTPWGVENQPDFLNAGCGIWTSLSPKHLLEALQSIENAHQRKREKHWGQRTLDLDIICFGDQEVDTVELKIPHPYFSKRRFVLEPLTEIYPDHTINNISLSDHLKNLAQLEKDTESTTNHTLT